MTIKKMLGAAAFTAACVVGGLHIPASAFAHELATQEEVAALKARVDALEGHANSLVSTDSDLFALVDELKARLDAGSVSWDQNAAVDDIYAILDRIAQAMEGADSTE